MYITKVIQTTVDLIDPNDIYTADIEALLLKKLNTRFQKVCYLSILILEVRKILRRSPIRMVDNRLDGGAYVDVQFEVYGVELVKDEILHDCKIIETHDNAIIAEHKYAGIKLQKDTLNTVYKILKIGQRIPIVVQKVKYTPNEKYISVIGTPFLPSLKQDIYYHVSRGLTPDEKTALQQTLNTITAESAQHSKFEESKQYKFFKELLYPYKLDQKFETSKKAATLKFIPVKFDSPLLYSINTGIIYYPNEDHRQNKRIFHSESLTIEQLQNQDTRDTTLQSGDLFSIMTDILNKYLIYLDALKGFMETYTTQESIQELLIYWKLCKNAQL